MDTVWGYNIRFSLWHNTLNLLFEIYLYDHSLAVSMVYMAVLYVPMLILQTVAMAPETVRVACDRCHPIASFHMAQGWSIKLSVVHGICLDIQAPFLETAEGKSNQGRAAFKRRESCTTPIWGHWPCLDCVVRGYSCLPWSTHGSVPFKQCG